MSDWLIRAGKLLNQGDRIETAADLVASRVCVSGVSSTSEALMAYALAERLLETTMHRIASQKETLADSDKQNLDTAIALARAALPNDHPLFLYFIKRASYYHNDLNTEVAALESALGQNVT